jgi:hypothetical protein
LWLRVDVFRVGQNVGDLNGLALKQHPSDMAQILRPRDAGYYDRTSSG